MAVTCPVDLDTVRLRNEIQAIYARVASAPDGEFHFHRGPEYAERSLRYDPLALARIPPFAVQSFAGVGNPLRMEPISAGATVVDIGCGSATDLLLAANAVGPGGRAIGIDMTDAMLRKAQAAAAEAGLANVDLRRGDALDLPIESASADFVISNGVLNLAPDKRRAFSEVLRVLRPGGRFLYADIVVASELPESIRRDIDLWSGWIGGALPEAELLWLLEDVGFDRVQVRERFDPFQGTSKEKVARKYRVAGVNVHAAKRQPWKEEPMPAHDVVRRRLEAQGFCGLDDAALAEIGPWLRWSPERAPDGPHASSRASLH